MLLSLDTSLVNQQYDEKYNGLNYPIEEHEHESDSVNMDVSNLPSEISDGVQLELGPVKEEEESAEETSEKISQDIVEEKYSELVSVQQFDIQ